MKLLCTIADKEYLGRVLVLDESRRTWYGESTLVALTLDEWSFERLSKLKNQNYVPGLEVVQFPGGGALESARQTRNYREWVWTVKPHWILEVMESLQPGDEVTYIDGDMMFFSHPASLFEELKGHDIGITPHRFSPSYERYVVNGNFNGAFVHVKNTPKALICVTRWASQCLELCSLKHQGDAFVDQKYLNSWPDLYGAHSIVHKGVNLAPWNQGENHYRYEIRDGRIFVDDQPLILYHYHSGLVPGYPLDEFISQFVYRPYASALERAQEVIAKCGS